MKKTLTIFAALALLVTVGIALDSGTAASNKIAKDTGLTCTQCHDKPGSKLMTDKGKYFELMGSFEGYDSLKASFSKCTHCHVRKPGSKKLTREGKKFKDLVGGMEGLRDWVKQNHPTGGEKK